MNLYSLPNRVARCVQNANQGDATVLMITESEREAAQRLVGSAPVIVATGPEIRQFLIHLESENRRKGKR